MNILYLCDEYPPGSHGGIGTAVQLLAREMVKMGNNVVVAGFYDWGYGGEDEFDDQGVKVYRFRRMLSSGFFANYRSIIVKITNRILKDTGILEWDIKKSLIKYKKFLDSVIARYHIEIVEAPDYNDYARFCKSYLPFPVLPAPLVVK
jgi:glycogen(starch) synthase